MMRATWRDVITWHILKHGSHSESWRIHISVSAISRPRSQKRKEYIWWEPWLIHISLSAVSRPQSHRVTRAHWNTLQCTLQHTLQHPLQHLHFELNRKQRTPQHTHRWKWESLYDESHDSHSEPWRIHISASALSRPRSRCARTRHLVCATWLIHVCDMTRTCERYQSYICAKWLIRILRHASYTCATCLIHICDMTRTCAR